MCPRMGTTRENLVSACLNAIGDKEKAQVEKTFHGRIAQATFAPMRLGIGKAPTKAFYEKAAQEWESYWQKATNQDNAP